jgi:hypothetical protein
MDPYTAAATAQLPPSTRMQEPEAPPTTGDQAAPQALGLNWPSGRAVLVSAVQSASTSGLTFGLIREFLYPALARLQGSESSHDMASFAAAVQTGLLLGCVHTLSTKGQEALQAWAGWSKPAASVDEQRFKGTWQALGALSVGALKGYLIAQYPGPGVSTALSAASGGVLFAIAPVIATGLGYQPVIKASTEPTLEKVEDELGRKTLHGMLAGGVAWMTESAGKPVATAAALAAWYSLETMKWYDTKDSKAPPASAAQSAIRADSKMADPAPSRLSSVASSLRQWWSPGKASPSSVLSTVSVRPEAPSEPPDFDNAGTAHLGPEPDDEHEQVHVHIRPDSPHPKPGEGGSAVDDEEPEQV